MQSNNEVLASAQAIDNHLSCRCNRCKCCAAAGRALASVLQAASPRPARVLRELVSLGTLTVTAKTPRIAGIFENGPSGRRVSDLVCLCFVTEEKTLARRQNARRARGKRVENA